MIGRWFRQELTLLLREPVAVFFSLAFPLVIYGFIGAPYANEEVAEGVRFIDVMFPALVGTVGANLLLMGMPVYFAELRARDVDRRYRVMPLPGWVFGTAIVLAMVVLVLAAAMLIVVVVGFAHGLRSDVVSPLFLALNVLQLVWLCCLGYFMGSLPIGSRTTQAVSAAVFFVFFFGSGAAAPIEGLPSWLRTVTEFNPLRHWFDLLTAVYTDGPVSDGTWVKALAVIPIAAGLAAWGLRNQKAVVS
jgi:ABC-2 type transport system permease protein